MSSKSTQDSSVASPPSTSTTSVSTVLEATPGCNHLAEFVQTGKNSKQDFVNGLAKAVKRAQKVDDPHSAALQYHCVQCSEAGDAKQIEIHCTKTQHAFSLCSQHSTVYCARCKDIIYDKMAKKANAGLSSTSETAKKRKSSEANGDDSYITANSAQRPCGREGARGLFNLGHTCYMNAVIQTMVHNSLLSSFFLGKGHPRHTCTKNEDEEEEEIPCVACGFTEVFSESRAAENTQPMAALSLLKASWLAIPVRETSLAGP
jgi:ubiquitin carboxyl-terminal hydrolase 22/27/51